MGHLGTKRKMFSVVLRVGDYVSTLLLVALLLLLAMFGGVVPAQAQPPPLWSYEAEDYVWSVSIEDVGGSIAAGGFGNNVTMFYHTSSEPIRSYETGGSVRCVSFGGVWAVAGCSDGYVHHIPEPGWSWEWSYDTGYPVLSVSSSPNGVYFVAGGMDNNISSFYYTMSSPLWQYATYGDVSSVAISGDGNTIVAGNLAGEVYLLGNDWVSPTLLWWYRVGEAPPFHDVDSVAISDDGEYIAVGSGIGDHTVYLFNNSSSTPLWNYTTGNRVFSVSISGDGEYIAAGSFDNKVYLFNRASSTPLWSYTTGGDVFSVSISGDGEYIAAGSSDNKVYLFNRASSTPLWSYTTGGDVRSVSIGTDHFDGVIRIAAGTASPSDHKVYLFEQTLEAALHLDDVQVWYWEDDTRIRSVAVGDVDGDGQTEIVTGGRYDDGTRDRAQLTVWDGSTLALEGVRTWYWTDDTFIESVALGDVDGDGSVEIVTGGSYWDGARHIAQLAVWNGSALALESVRTWHWGDDTVIKSIDVGDVDGDGDLEIVTGGYHWDGTRYNAQLVVWDGSTLALEGVTTWHWTADTYIYSVVCADVDGDGDVEIVTGGTYYDGSLHFSQLCVWSGGTLTLEDVKTWYWTGNTAIRYVTVGDVDGDGDVEIVTGGDYHDGTRRNAQLCVWNGSTLSLERVVTWYWTSLTHVNSVACADVDEDGSVEIVTGGWFWDVTRYVAQLCVWDGGTLALEDVMTWYWVGATYVESVAVADVDIDGAFEIVTGGRYDDGTRYVAQLCIWGCT